MCRNYLASALLLTLVFAGCAVPVAPAASAPREVIEYRQLVNSDPEHVAKMVVAFFPVQVVSDERTQTLVVKGLPEQVAMAIDMVNRIEATQSLGDLPLQHFFIKRLHNAKAEDVAAELKALVEEGAFAADWRPLNDQSIGPALVVVFDERSNALLVNVDVIYEERIRNIIDELDRSDTPGTQPEIRLESGTLSPRQPVP
jgi:type II secretory pathway component GspD/PulD (secretin)